MEENKTLFAEQEDTLLPVEEPVDAPVDADALSAEAVEVEETPAEETVEETVEESEDNVPLDRNVKLMSPTRMVIRRFFRSRLSIVGLIMVVGLFLFSFVGPVFFAESMHKETINGVQVETYTPGNGKWGETELDETGRLDYATAESTYTVNGVTYTVYQTTETQLKDNSFSRPSGQHLLGTDKEGYDIFVRLMYGGRISLIVSFLAVFLITILGVVLGGISGYFGGWIDNLIMRLSDILMCLPGVPILLIIHTLLEAANVPKEYRIYLMMVYLTFISWTGTARLVRGQILSLREQEFMVAAEAMGYSTGRKIFKHLVPNVMPQLIVQMTLSLGSMILYESTLSYLNLGVPAPYAAWGTMINVINDTDILQNYPFVWVPAGICIVIAVLGFNFVGDGLRDALDPKARR